MAAISKVIRLSQNLRGAEPPMVTLCIGFVGRRFQKKYCQIHHAIISAILEAIFQKMAAFFKIIRVIFEKRQIIVTLVSTYIIFREYYSDSILLRASHNGGHNLASASAFSLLANIENEINASTPLIFTEPYQYSSSESDM